METSLDMMVADPVTIGLEADVSALRAEIEALKCQIAAQEPDDTISIICFSGEWDRLFAALTIAAGSLAMGLEAHLFFTFWGMTALRGVGKANTDGKSFLQTMFNRMLPSGPGRAPLSKFNYGGLGKLLMRKAMKDSGVDDINTLFNDVKDLGAHFHLCDTTTELFGLKCNELSVGDQVDHCGVTSFLSLALKSRMVLFV